MKAAIESCINVTCTVTETSLIVPLGRIFLVATLEYSRYGANADIIIKVCAADSGLTLNGVSANIPYGSISTYTFSIKYIEGKTYYLGLYDKPIISSDNFAIVNFDTYGITTDGVMCDCNIYSMQGYEYTDLSTITSLNVNTVSVWFSGEGEPWESYGNTTIKRPYLKPRGYTIKVTPDILIYTPDIGGFMAYNKNIITGNTFYKLTSQITKTYCTIYYGNGNIVYLVDRGTMFS